MMGRVLIAASLAASAALVSTFLALGGSAYAPAPTRDPCEPRPWRQGGGLQRTAEQFTLSALDGTACKLHVSRETLVLALASREGRERFADDPHLEAAVRAGLKRGIDDAERAGAIGAPVATALRALARNAPVAQAIDFIRNAAPIFGRLDQLLEGARVLLPPELQPLVP